MQSSHGVWDGIAARDISTVRIPVGTMIMLYPISIINAARALPNGDSGVASPYPTVVMVTIAQYSDFGMESNDLLPQISPSMRYMAEAMRMRIVATARMKTAIFCRHA
jgi:hypothetical protein